MAEDEGQKILELKTACNEVAEYVRKNTSELAAIRFKLLERINALFGEIVQKLHGFEL